MFFRKITLFLCIFSLSTITFGCSKKAEDASEETVIEITTEEKMLATAFELFNIEPLRATNTIYTTTYEDGTSKSETENIIYDASKSIIEKCHTTEDIVERTFYVREGEDVYCYEDDNSYNEEWVRYLDIPDDNADTSFDTTLSEFEYSFNEASGYSDVTITNAGTEVLNDITTIKLVVTATFKPLSENETENEDDDSLSSDSVTRESLIAEFEWSEESVNAVDGFSEILDQYVAYLNNEEVVKQSSEDSVEEYIFWIDKDSSRILQMQTSFSAEDVSDTLNSNIEEEFWNESWKVDWIQYDLNDGLTLEESLEIFEAEVDAVEEQIKYEDSMESPDEDVSENGSSAKEIIYVKTFLIADECPAMTEIPSVFAETTYEDYYNTFEDDIE